MVEVVDLDGLALADHAAALQQHLDELKHALDDPNTSLDFDAAHPITDVDDVAVSPDASDVDA